MSSLLSWMPEGTPLEQSLYAAGFFVAIQAVYFVFLWILVPIVRTWSYTELNTFFFAFGSQVHALIVIYLCFSVILGPSNDVLLADRTFGYDELSMKLHAFSCGYFIFDIFVVLSQIPLDFKFLLHALVCSAAYYLAQSPFFQYYTTRFLLYELSTPLLNVRLLLVSFKADAKWISLTDMLFGLSFVAARLVYGIPMAYEFLLYLHELIQTHDGKPDTSPSLPTLYFSSFAIFSMASLNVVWFASSLYGMVAGGSKPKSD